MTTAKNIQNQLRSMRNETYRIILERYFQTGIGQYAEGDQFLGIKVPTLRAIAKTHAQLPLEENASLLQSNFHEERFLALIILIIQYRHASLNYQITIYDHYCKHTQWINHWDLVDVSASAIAGAHLLNRERHQLYVWANSNTLWERRIAIIATHYFLKHDDLDDSLALAQRLVNDPEDLIHKAVGWTLRELAKRDQVRAEEFLQHHLKSMPRTILRYAIERFPLTLRNAYRDGTILSMERTQRNNEPSA